MGPIDDVTIGHPIEEFLLQQQGHCPAGFGIHDAAHDPKTAYIMILFFLDAVFLEQ
jgi:hypothetical protein